MNYASFDYYKDTFLGTVILTENEFNHHALFATRYIDLVTFNRLNDDVSDTVKNCCCSLAECYFSASVLSSKTSSGVTSEKVGDYSVTYSDSSSNSEKALQNNLNSIAKFWLADSGLMFKGVVQNTTKF